jgi:glucose/arabinose dehydrogenase
VLWRIRGLLGVCAVVVVGVIAYNLTPYLPERRLEPSSVATEHGPVRVVTITHRLSQPWGMAFLPNGDILITERRGRLRLVHEGKLQVRSAGGVPPVVTTEQAGLMDIALHPHFAENGLLYLTYSKPGPRGDAPPCCERGLTAPG